MSRTCGVVQREKHAAIVAAETFLFIETTSDNGHEPVLLNHNHFSGVKKAKTRLKSKRNKPVSVTDDDDEESDEDNGIRHVFSTITHDRVQCLLLGKAQTRFVVANTLWYPRVELLLEGSAFHFQRSCRLSGCTK